MTAADLASFCPAEKFVYERCFQRWYSDDYLKANSRELPCAREWDLYRGCVRVSCLIRPPFLLAQVSCNVETNGRSWL